MDANGPDEDHLDRYRADMRRHRRRTAEHGRTADRRPPDASAATGGEEVISLARLAGSTFGGCRMFPQQHDRWPRERARRRVGPPLPS